MAKQFQKIRGTYDILPERWQIFSYVINTYSKLAEDAGFGRIVTPTLEDKNLFVRSIGEGTDVLDKEIYEFEDRGGHQVALRPEGTAGVTRSYLENGLGSRPSPMKLYYIEDMYRYDRPQEGRFRQHQQMGAEIFGDASPSADVQMIMLMRRLYGKLGLANVSLQVNSIGDEACRSKYHKDLVDYLHKHTDELAEIDRERLKKNPLRVLDSKEGTTQVVLDDAPQILNYLCADCQKHFAGVLEYLDDMAVDYEVNHRLVRGLDYYTRTVFEFYGNRQGAQSALGGGGRYDMLVERLGGQATPAVGFGCGLERVILELESENLVPEIENTIGAYVVSLGETARLAAFRLVEELLDKNVAATSAIKKDNIGSQLAKADKAGARYAVIIGEREVKEKTVLLRDMKSSAQETVKRSDITKELVKRTQG